MVAGGYGGGTQVTMLASTNLRNKAHAKSFLKSPPC
jgi:hypothetical protein